MSDYFVPMTDARKLAALGKLGEECAELSKVVCRCVIQGYLEADPETGKPNLVALLEEVADVRALSRVVIDEFGLDENQIIERAGNKAHHKRRWLDALTSGEPVDYLVRRADGSTFIVHKDQVQPIYAGKGGR